MARRKFPRKSPCLSCVHFLIAAAILLAMSIEISCAGGPAPVPTQSVQNTTPPAPPATPTTPPATPVTTDIRNVVIVVEENKDYTDVIGSSAMPYLNSLASKYGVAADFLPTALIRCPTTLC